MTPYYIQAISIDDIEKTRMYKDGKGGYTKHRTTTKGVNTLVAEGWQLVSAHYFDNADFNDIFLMKKDFPEPIPGTDTERMKFTRVEHPAESATEAEWIDYNT